jgi:hypothetical protein
LREEQNELRIYDEFEVFPNRGWHLIYANLDFSRVPVRRSQRLVQWLKPRLPDSWTANRILGFLKEHQGAFRDCLDWISNRCEVEFEQYEDYEVREKWEQMPEVRFFKTHALGHARLTLEPGWQEDLRLDGLKLVQQEAQDPLDPICWYVLTLLASYGRAFIGLRCAYWRCGKYFWPRTKRARYHSDSCRALDHASNEKIEDRDKFLEKKKTYMQEYRSRPEVKLRS